MYDLDYFKNWCIAIFGNTHVHITDYPFCSKDSIYNAIPKYLLSYSYLYYYIFP